MSWLGIGAVLFAVHAPWLLALSAAVRRRDIWFVLFLGLSFPVWGYLAGFGSILLFGGLRQIFTGFVWPDWFGIIVFGALPGAVTAIWLGTASRNVHLGVAIGVAIVPAALLTDLMSGVFPTWVTLPPGPMPLAVVLWNAIVCVCIAVWAVWRRVSWRLPSWACDNCGYDLRGLESVTCPECGRPITASAAA